MRLNPPVAAPAGAIRSAMSPGDWGLLVTLSLLWGGAFFFIGVAVDELPPLTIVVLRVGIAAAALLALAPLLGGAPPARLAVWGAFALMGLFNNVAPFSLIVWGQTEIGSGLAAILNAATPLFTVLVAHVFTTDERATPRKLAGVALGFVGVAAMIGASARGGLDGAALGQLAVLGAAVSYAIAGVYGRRFRRMGVSPVATATGQLVCSTLMLAPVALLIEAPFALPAPSLATSLAILALALFGTALAYLIYFRLLASAGATNLLLVTLLIPVSAAILGAAFLGERLTWIHLFGMATIALGLALIDGRLLPRRRGGETA